MNSKTVEEENDEIRKNIRLKYDQLHRLQQHSNRILEDTFQPITKPLNEIKKYQVVDLSGDEDESNTFDSKVTR